MKLGEASGMAYAHKLVEEQIVLGLSIPLVLPSACVVPNTCSI